MWTNLRNSNGDEKETVNGRSKKIKNRAICGYHVFMTLCGMDVNSVISQKAQTGYLSPPMHAYNKQLKREPTNYLPKAQIAHLRSLRAALDHGGLATATKKT